VILLRWHVEVDVLIENAHLDFVLMTPN
jgi:hypothetical protein